MTLNPFRLCHKIQLNLLIIQIFRPLFRPFFIKIIKKIPTLSTQNQPAFDSGKRNRLRRRMPVSITPSTINISSSQRIEPVEPASGRS